jgi:hypoxanthine phosphoribosyltransferase
VRDAYVVSDNELDDKNHLYSRYNGANFLIVDEDMNSGGTLMLLINALKDKLVGHVNRTKKGPYGRIKSNQITCLVNSYSLKG